MGWYAMFVKTGYEEDVCFSIDNTSPSSFEDIDYNFLLPKRKIYERKQGITKEVVRKLFPGYILVETDKIIDFYLRFKNTANVIRFLGNSKNFYEIEFNEIASISYMADNEGLIDISKAFIINDRIKVVKGPLTGKEGIIKKLDKRKGRAKVEFSINYHKYLIDLGIDILHYSAIKNIDENKEELKI